MKHIGFYGGSSIVELERVNEMIDFLAFLEQRATSVQEKEVVKRLYHKYLRFEDLDVALSLLENLNKKDVGKFDRYVNGLMHCVISAKGFYEDWNVYKPVKILPTDMPDFMEERDRPLVSYDMLKNDEPPYWVKYQ